MIKEALAAHVKATERIWPHDRTMTVGASEIGLCARRNWFLKHSTPPDPDYVQRWGALTRGNVMENWWQKALRRQVGAGHLHYAGPYQRTFVDDEAPLSATPDGLVNIPEKNWCFSVECKTVDPRTSLYEPKPEHVFQCNVQLGLIRQQTRYRPKYAILSYVDACFWDEITEFTIKFDRAAFEEARNRARAIMQANSPDDLRPEGYISGGAECEYCQFKHSCTAMRAGRVPGKEERVEGSDLERLAAFAKERARTKAEIERLEADARGLDEDIKDILLKNGTRRAEGLGYRVVWSALKGRPAWDWPALRVAAEEAGLDLAPFERVGEPSDRLQIWPASQTKRKAA